MSRLMRDGTAETVSRNEILSSGANADREIFIFPVFPVQLTTSRIGNLTRFDPYSYLSSSVFRFFGFLFIMFF